MNLEKIYKSLGIDAATIKCEYESAGKCFNPELEPQGEYCYTGNIEGCIYARRYYIYPELDTDTVSDIYILSLLKVLMKQEITIGDTIIIFKDIKINYENFNSGLFKLLEMALEQNKLSDEQKDEIFYIITYLV